MNGSKMSLDELALLEEEKIAFIQRLKNQFGSRLKKYHSVHVQVRDLDGQRIVSFSVNGPDNKGVVVFLDKDLAGATRTDVHAGQLRRLNVDWVSLLLPFGQQWANLNLIFKRIEQKTPPQQSRSLSLSQP
jgi:hypothetical protein